MDSSAVASTLYDAKLRSALHGDSEQRVQQKAQVCRLNLQEARKQRLLHLEDYKETQQLLRQYKDNLAKRKAIITGGPVLHRQVASLFGEVLCVHYCVGSHAYWTVTAKSYIIQWHDSQFEPIGVHWVSNTSKGQLVAATFCHCLCGNGPHGRQRASNERTSRFVYHTSSKGANGGGGGGSLANTAGQPVSSPSHGDSSGGAGIAAMAARGSARRMQLSKAQNGAVLVQSTQSRPVFFLCTWDGVGMLVRARLKHSNTRPNFLSNLAPPAPASSATKRFSQLRVDCLAHCRMKKKWLSNLRLASSRGHQGSTATSTTKTLLQHNASGRSMGSTVSLTGSVGDAELSDSTLPQSDAEADISGNDVDDDDEVDVDVGVHHSDDEKGMGPSSSKEAGDDVKGGDTKSAAVADDVTSIREAQWCSVGICQYVPGTDWLVCISRDGGSLCALSCPPSSEIASLPAVKFPEQSKSTSSSTRFLQVVWRANPLRVALASAPSPFVASVPTPSSTHVRPWETEEELLEAKDNLKMTALAVLNTGLLVVVGTNNGTLLRIDLEVQEEDSALTLTSGPTNTNTNNDNTSAPASPPSTPSVASSPTNSLANGTSPQPNAADTKQATGGSAVSSSESGNVESKLAEALSLEAKEQHTSQNTPEDDAQGTDSVTSSPARQRRLVRRALLSRPASDTSATPVPLLSPSSRLKRAQRFRVVCVVVRVFTRTVLQLRPNDTAQHTAQDAESRRAVRRRTKQSILLKQSLGSHVDHPEDSQFRAKRTSSAVAITSLSITPAARIFVGCSDGVTHVLRSSQGSSRVVRGKAAANDDLVVMDPQDHAFSKVLDPVLHVAATPSGQHLFTMDVRGKVRRWDWHDNDNDIETQDDPVAPALRAGQDTDRLFARPAGFQLSGVTQTVSFSDTSRLSLHLVPLPDHRVLHRKRTATSDITIHGRASMIVTRRSTPPISAKPLVVPSGPHFSPSGSDATGSPISSNASPVRSNQLAVPGSVSHAPPTQGPASPVGSPTHSLSSAGSPTPSASSSTAPSAPVRTPQWALTLLGQHQWSVWQVEK